MKKLLTYLKLMSLLAFAPPTIAMDEEEQRQEAGDAFFEYLIFFLILSSGQRYLNEPITLNSPYSFSGFSLWEYFGDHS